MQLNHKFRIHYGEQRSDEWHGLRLGKFTSSTVWQLFETPTKQSRAKAAAAQIISGGWLMDSRVADYRPDNDAMNYAAKYLVNYGLIEHKDIKKAKSDIRAAYKDKFFNFDDIDLYDIKEASSLIMRACFAINEIDILSGSAVGLAERKSAEIIHGEPEPEIKNVPALDWGNDSEPLASRYFQSVNLEFIQEKKISFVEIEGMESGSSPDDVIEGSFVPVEYKCPHNRIIHLRHKRLKTAEDLFRYDKQKYYQIQHQIYALKEEFGFWNSFDKRLLRRKSTADGALHTIKINLNKKVASQFEYKIKQATAVRDNFVNEFFNK